MPERAESPEIAKGARQKKWGKESEGVQVLCSYKSRSRSRASSDERKFYPEFYQVYLPVEDSVYLILAKKFICREVQVYPSITIFSMM